MKYYINGSEVTRKEMKTKYYIEKYRMQFIKIFIIKYLKMNLQKIIAGVLLIGGILFTYSIVNANENIKPESLSGNLCQNLAFSNPERFKNECDVQTVQNIIKEVKTGKYKEIEERAFEVIVKFEGFHDKPYWDHKQWSCGYGMRCNKNTTGITKEKSKWFVVERIKHIREKYSLYGYDDNLEVALISFTYNIGHPPKGYRWYIQKGYINGLKNRMKAYSYASGKYLRGLAIRRNFETNLF